MKNKLLIILLGFGILTLGFIATAIAVVPDHINYQGILRNSAGDLQSGTFSMTFTIYDAATAGNVKLTDGPRDIVVSNGLYNAEVGTITGAIFDGGDRWLEVTVGTDVLAPRLKINSVAYAVQTENADYATTAGSASNADYATLSGTASNAAKAGGYFPSLTPGATEIPVTNGIGQINAEISAEANGSNPFALFINGALGATVNTCVGRDKIPNGTDTVTIDNTNVTANSLIFTSISTNASFAATETLQVYDVVTDQFKVKPMDGDTAADIWFNYLIIN